jgi:hypothetical protein
MRGKDEGVMCTLGLERIERRDKNPEERITRTRTRITCSRKTELGHRGRNVGTRFKL